MSTMLSISGVVVHFSGTSVFSGQPFMSRPLKKDERPFDYFCGWKNKPYLGRGGGQAVSVLAFSSNAPSSNHAGVYNFSGKNCC